MDTAPFTLDFMEDAPAVFHAAPCSVRVKVVRHGNRRGDSWRTLYEGADQDKANAIYQKTYLALRQGTVALVDCASGKAIKQFSAPNLRSRW